jgi:hypothetical protein
LDWERKWLSLNRRNYTRQSFRLLAKCSISLTYLREISLA